MSRSPPPLKTYSHLGGQQRVPSEYDIVTSRLLYHPQRGFEVDVPLRAFYERYQRDARVVCRDWEAFQDPRQTTYPGYTALQARQEAHLDDVARSWESAEHDRAQIASSRATFLHAMAPLRFALHGFQMIAAHVGQMAPSGRIAIVALFQAADQLRRVHRIAMRLGELRLADRVSFDDGRAAWQTGPAWQPLRRAVETALVAFDWSEALAALNLCLVPLVEALFLGELGRVAKQRQDFLLWELLSSFAEDGRWHRAWTEALFRLAIADRPENREALQGFVDRWYPPAAEAIAAALPLVSEDAAAARIAAGTRDWLGALGLVPP